MLYTKVDKLIERFKSFFYKIFMKKVEIYTKPTCGYCKQAKNLLMAKNISYIEIDLAEHPEKREEMLQRTEGKTSVPEIFVDGKLIGGCDDIYALEEKGELDTILGI